MDFLNLYHEVYPPCDDDLKNRISYPYGVKIPDVNKRIAFVRMLERDGFECVIHENGLGIVYVNFTLRRFGNAVKAVQSGCINHLYDMNEFIKEIYVPYTTNPSVRALLSNNYKQSAAMQLSGTVNGLILNGDKHVDSYEAFEINKIQNAEKQMSESLVSIVEPTTDYRVPIKEEHVPSSHVWFRPVKLKKHGDEYITDDSTLGSTEEFSIEVGDFNFFLWYFVYDTLDHNLEYNKKIIQQDEINDYIYTPVHYYFTYESIEKMCVEILNAVDMLSSDYDNPALGGLKENFDIYGMTNDMEDLMYRCGDTKVFIRHHIYVALEFYLRFVNRIRQMLDRNTETDILSIMEPR